MVDDSYLRRLLSLDEVEEYPRERREREQIIDLSSLYSFDDFNNDNIIRREEPRERTYDSIISNEILNNYIINQEESQLIEPQNYIINSDRGSLLSERRERNNSLEEILIRFNNINENHIDRDRERLLENYNINDIQQNIESIIGGNNDLLNNNAYADLLNYTKKMGREHSPEYFAQQALLMTGLPNPQLAEALSGFQEGRVDRTFGVEYLRGFVKQNAELPDEELSRYALKHDIQLDNSQYGNGFGHKYFDTKFNFCLTYDGQLIASVGFDAAQDRMYIWQIQGIRGNRDKLKPIKWERALASYAVQWAEDHGIPEVSIVSVDNNKWANMHGHLDKEQGKMLYDVTARRIGFRDRDADGNYVKQLEVSRRMPISISETVPAYAQAVNF